MLSHRNMVYNVAQSISWQGDAYDGVQPLIAITALPLYHIFSLQGNCLLGMAQGGLNVLITNPRDMPGFVKEISKFKFNLFHGRQHDVCGPAEHAGIQRYRLLRVARRGWRRHGRTARSRKEWHEVTGQAYRAGLRPDRNFARRGL